MEKRTKKRDSMPIYVPIGRRKVAEQQENPAEPFSNANSDVASSPESVKPDVKSESKSKRSRKPRQEKQVYIPRAKRLEMEKELDQMRNSLNNSTGCENSVPPYSTISQSDHKIPEQDSNSEHEISNEPCKSAGMQSSGENKSLPDPKFATSSHVHTTSKGKQNVISAELNIDQYEVTSHNNIDPSGTSQGATSEESESLADHLNDSCLNSEDVHPNTDNCQQPVITLQFSDAEPSEQDEATGESSGNSSDDETPSDEQASTVNELHNGLSETVHSKMDHTDGHQAASTSPCDVSTESAIDTQTNTDIAPSDNVSAKDDVTKSSVPMERNTSAECKTSIEDNSPVTFVKKDTALEASDDKILNCQGVKKYETERKVSEADDEDSDSWENKFDDEGECLDDETIKEITKAIGKVKVKKPTIDYLSYVPSPVSTDPNPEDDRYSHLLELYGFSASLKTQDLMNVFKSYLTSEFSIRWVDDTHAIGVFSSASVANEALKEGYTLVKCRPISQGCKATRDKVKSHPTEFINMLPPKERPQTNAMTARRLVTSSLGLSVRVSKEQRQKERDQLRDAKARKNQSAAAKRQIWDGDIEDNDSNQSSSSSSSLGKWDGKIGKCAMDQV